MTHCRRVVLDTNVVLSALLFAQGRLSALRNAWQQGRFIPLVSSVSTGELMRVLAYPKFRLSAPERHELLADYLPYCTTIPMPTKPPVTPVCRDPFDQPFLQLALVGKADFLVTGDQYLLALSVKFACPILPPEQFLRELYEDTQ